MTINTLFPILMTTGYHRPRDVFFQSYKKDAVSWALWEAHEFLSLVDGVEMELRGVEEREATIMG